MRDILTPRYLCQYLPNDCNFHIHICLSDTFRGIIYLVNVWLHTALSCNHQLHAPVTSFVFGCSSAQIGIDEMFVGTLVPTSVHQFTGVQWMCGTRDLIQTSLIQAINDDSTILQEQARMDQEIMAAHQQKLYEREKLTDTLYLGEDSCLLCL